jgi:GNAT superfamily N-acetyltransferase
VGSKDVNIRRVGSQLDWVYLYDLCVRTAQPGGKPLHGSRAELEIFSEYWIDPYRWLPGGSAWLATGAEPAPREEKFGYVTVAWETRQFERWLRGLRLLQTLKWKWQYRGTKSPWVACAWKCAKEGSRNEATLWGEARLKSWHRDFPAHLHMNVESHSRGKGVGRKLWNHVREELVRREVSGCHLFCGEGPKAFYEKLGFRVLGERRTKESKVKVWALGNSIS